MKGAGGGCRRGFTLVEILLGSFIMVVALGAMMGAFVSHSLLGANARNLTAALNDATSVMEQIRVQNTGSGCGSPSAEMSGGWDAWLEAQPQGRSLRLPTNELVALTCQDESGASYCGRGGSPKQVATQEWASQPGQTTYDPIRVTVAVCWRHQGRVIGECQWRNNALEAVDGINGPNNRIRVIESPAMLTTLITCRNQ